LLGSKGVVWHTQTDESNINSLGKPSRRSKPEFSRTTALLMPTWLAP